MIGGGRREARERALSLLYEAESKDAGISAVLAELPISPEEFVLDLVRGIESALDKIDEILETHAIGWTVDRMPVIDRNVLRLAVFELLEQHDTPVGVVISEAVELAKRYSTEESGRFVNGLLATVAAAVRPA